MSNIDDIMTEINNLNINKPSTFNNITETSDIYAHLSYVVRLVIYMLTFHMS